MKHIVIALWVILLAGSAAWAQSPKLQWAQRKGSYNQVYNIGYVGLVDMKLSQNKELVSIGSYDDGPVDMDGGPGIDTIRGYGMFICKDDTAGNHLWVKTIPYSGAQTRMQDMDVDTAGNIYVTGYFNGTLDLSPGPSVYNITANGGSGYLDIFIAKYDRNGNLLWAHPLGGTGSDQGRSITTDSAGNVYITGLFNGIADFDPGPGNQTLSALNQDCYIAKFNTNGDLIWAKNLFGINNEEGRDIAATGAGVYITGLFYGTVDFDPGPATHNLVSPTSSSNAFLLKLDTAGNYTWAANFGDYNDDYGNTVTIDHNGNPVMSGFFSSVMDCDPGPATYTLTPSYYFDFFILKLTSAGSFVWAKKFGLPATSYNYSYYSMKHSLDTSGNIYLTGNFKDTADFDPGPGIHNHTTIWDPNTGTYDYGAFLLLLDNNGGYKWSTQYGRHGQNNWGTGIAPDNKGSFYAAGNFNDTDDFDPGPAVTLLQNPPTQFSGSGSGAYLLRFGQCFATSGSRYDTACGMFAYNNVIYTHSGTYTQTLVNAAGCDSTLSLHVYIPEPDTTITRQGNTLNAMANATTYQWVNCSTNTPILGATQQQYTPTSSGSFALIVSVDGCSDTSGCHNFVHTGIADVNGAADDVTVSPNPATSLLYIQGTGLVQARLYNIEGRLLMTAAATAGQATLQLRTLAPGCYLLRTTDARGRVHMQKVVKE